jgi:hypothetical protein
MKHKILAALSAVAFLFAMVLPGSAFAAPDAGAYGTAFVTSITYQNLSGTTANITFNFQAANSSTQTPVNVTLAGNASSSLFLGNVNALSSPFKGSAVMSSDQPIVATLVQVPQSATVKNRPLSNGFSAGSSTVLIATALKNTFDENSIITIQNSDSVPNDITVKFFPVGSSTPADTETVTNLPAGASQYYDLGTSIGTLPNPFNGSVTVTAIKHGGAPGSGNVVATVMELAISGNGADAFEGVAAGSSTVYMPSALCNAFGGQNTSYAIQNASNATANVVVHYSSGQNPGFAIPAGSKHSFLACADGVPAGTSGSASITSDQPIVGIGKVTGLGLSTAFVGPSAGASHLALPYVRWATDANYNNGSQQRTFLAIQNVGGSPIAASAITIQYIGPTGVVQGTDHNASAVAAGAKFNSTAASAGLSEFGINGGQFGGGVIISGPPGSQLVAIARVQSVVPGNGIVGEDYNAIVIP